MKPFSHPFQSECQVPVKDWRVCVCEDWNQNDTNSCKNALHQLAFFKRHPNPFSRGYLEIRPLEDCQLYTVAISPARNDGSPMIPGERYTSIHSTLCSPTLTQDEIQTPTRLPHKNSNSELVVVLITMILIGSAMVCLALKSISSLSNGNGNRRGRGGRRHHHLHHHHGLDKTYYHPTHASKINHHPHHDEDDYDDDYVLESMK